MSAFDYAINNSTDFLQHRFHPGDTLSVQTSTSNDTKSSSNSLEGGKRYKLSSYRQHIDASLEEHSFESEEHCELNIQVARQHDKERPTVIDNESISESNTFLLFRGQM